MATRVRQAGACSQRLQDRKGFGSCHLLIVINRLSRFPTQEQDPAHSASQSPSFAPSCNSHRLESAAYFHIPMPLQAVPDNIDMLVPDLRADNDPATAFNINLEDGKRLSGIQISRLLPGPRPEGPARLGRHRSQPVRSCNWPKSVPSGDRANGCPVDWRRTGQPGGICSHAGTRNDESHGLIPMAGVASGFLPPPIFSQGNTGR
jgi:hypothetical protein